MNIRVYTSPQAFKHALADRLRTMSKDGFDLARRRQLLVFDRFLARIVSHFGDAVTLKGGLVLELRLARARATKDVDLRMQGDPSNLLDRLQRHCCCIRSRLTLPKSCTPTRSHVTD